MELFKLKFIYALIMVSRYTNDLINIKDIAHPLMLDFLFKIINYMLFLKLIITIINYIIYLIFVIKI